MNNLTSNFAFQMPTLHDQFKSFQFFILNLTIVFIHVNWTITLETSQQSLFLT